MISFVFSLLACSSVTPPSDPTPVDEVVGVNAKLPDDSLYQLRTRLQVADASMVELAVHRGHPTIVSMFYANCPMACPMLIQDILIFEARLEPEEREELRVLLVSLDPERDTPELLAGVIKTHHVDTTRWVLGRTKKAEVREVAAVLGIRYRELADGEMNHSSILTLLDGEGRVVTTQEGLKQNTDALLGALRGL